MEHNVIPYPTATTISGFAIAEDESDYNLTQPIRLYDAASERLLKAIAMVDMLMSVGSNDVNDETLQNYAWGLHDLLLEAQGQYRELWEEMRERVRSK